MPLTMSAAGRRAASLVGGPTPFSEPNWCQHWCSRTVYNDQGPYYWGGNGKAWAVNMWLGAVAKGKVVRTTDPAQIPSGAMVFSKGSSVYGHVFIGDGVSGCYTTDFPVSRKIGHVPIRQLLNAWGHTLLGYIEVTGAGTDYRGQSAAMPMPTVWDQLSWNVASPKWYTPWGPRQEAIGNSLRGDASINCFQEVYSEEQAADIQRALGANFRRVSAPSGLELFYDFTRWELVAANHIATGVQGRYLQKVTLKRRQSGKVIRFGNTHAPALSASLRSSYGKRLEPLLADVDVLCGDFNTGKNNLSPRKNIRAAGFRDMREQCSVKNEGMAEFPTKGKWLADIYSNPKRVRITYGEMHLTTARESDHRELTARMEAI